MTNLAIPAEPGPDAPLSTAADLGPVRLIWMNQPARRNPLSPDLRRAMVGLIDDAHADPAVRCIVVAGAGGCFSAGGDISTMSGMDAQTGRARMRPAADFMRRFVEGPKPVIAAVSGYAVGAGLSLMAACDLVVAGQGAKFALSFGKIGLMPDLGVLHTLPARIGTGRTRLMALTRRTIGADVAADWGLVDQVVPDDQVMAEALALAAEVAEGAPLSNTYTRQLLARLPMSFGDFMAAEADAQALLFGTEDFAEGASAFLQKRKPVFKGR